MATGSYKFSKVFPEMVFMINSSYQGGVEGREICKVLQSAEQLKPHWRREQLKGLIKQQQVAQQLFYSLSHLQVTTMMGG